ACAMAPAPSVLAFPVAKMECDELSMAIGVVDLALRPLDGCFVKAHRGSDGVDFAVEIECDGKRKRIWTRSLTKEDVGKGFVEASADLTPFRGRAVMLRLISDPGAAGNNTYDYAVWGDLRLRGAPTTKPTRPNVVIIDIDTLRADRLSCYGNPRKTSPRLDAR